MKGYVVEERMSSGTMDWVHGGGGLGKRIIVPELNNLALTFYDGQLAAYDGYQKKEDTKVIVEEVNVPEELVLLAIDFMESTRAFYAMEEEIKKLMGTSD